MGEESSSINISEISEEEEEEEELVDIDSVFVCTIISAVLKGDSIFIIPSGYNGIDTCAICKSLKRCSYQINGRLISTCCVPLMAAVIRILEETRKYK